MANGKPGDSPFTDIVAHGLEVISPEVTRLVKEIVKLGDNRLDALAREIVWSMRPELGHPSNRKLMVTELELTLARLLSVGNDLAAKN